MKKNIPNGFFKTAAFTFALLTSAQKPLHSRPSLTFKSADFYSKVSLSSSSKNQSSDSTENDFLKFAGQTKYAYTFGTKLNFNLFTLKLSLSQKSLAFSKLPSLFTFDAEKNILPYTENLTAGYGLQSQLSPEKFPFAMNFYIGKITIGGTFSRMKSPALAPSSSLSKSFILQGGLSPKLSSTSSTGGTLTFAADIYPSKKEFLFLPRLQTALFFNGDAILSMYKTFSFSNTSQLSLNFTAARLQLSNDPTSSWFLKEKVFLKERLFFFHAESNLSFPHFRINFISSINQSPFENFNFYTRSQQAFIFGPFTFKSAEFFSSPNAIRADGSTQEKAAQFFFNPQVKFKISASTFQAGFLYQKDFSLTKDSSQTFYTSDFFRTDMSILTKEISFSAKASLKIQDEEKNFSASLSAATKKTKIKSATSAALTFSATNLSISLSQKFTFPTAATSPLTPDIPLPPGSRLSLKENPSPLKSLTFQAKSVFKNQIFYSQTLETSLAFSKSAGKIRINGNLSFKISF